MNGATRVQVIGVAFDRCSPEKGSFLGPEALRHAGLREAIAAEGFEAEYFAPYPLAVPESTEEANGFERDADEPRLSFPNEFLEMAGTVRSAVSQTLDAEEIPLVVGGDHSISLASIAAALDKHGDDLVVLWIDAHADVNLPSTSRTGNIHGMPLAALVRRELDPEIKDESNQHYWDRILQEIVPEGKRLNPANMAWFGLRSVDPGESDFILKTPGAWYRTMQDIDNDGMKHCVESFLEWLGEDKNRKVWVSFDVDVLDPILAPGTGTMVRGGLTYREGHYLAERLSQAFFSQMLLGATDRLVGLDVMEVNPLQDQANTTASVAVEWVASFFGKKILKRS